MCARSLKPRLLFHSTDFIWPAPETTPEICTDCAGITRLWSRPATGSMILTVSGAAALLIDVRHSDRMRIKHGTLGILFIVFHPPTSEVLTAKLSSKPVARRTPKTGGTGACNQMNCLINVRVAEALSRAA